MKEHQWERAPDRDIYTPLQAWRCSKCGITIFSNEPEKSLTHLMGDCDLVIVRQVQNL